MNGRRRTINILFTSFLVLISCLSISTAITSAKVPSLYSFSSVVNINYDSNATNIGLLPIDRVLEIPLTIDYFVAGYFKDTLLPIYNDTANFVYLDIFNEPEWCSASLSPNFLLMIPTTDGVTEKVTLILKIDEAAHAFSQGEIGIKAKVNNMAVIKGGNFYSNISFKIGYLPILNIKVPENSVKLTNPYETTKFDIELENLGNGKTSVSYRIINAPKGWIISIEPTTLLGTNTIGDNPKKTVTLSIRPPHEFGYHDDREVITLGLTPKYFENPAISGQEYLVSFIVQSRGFSTPGFESAFVFIALIGIIILAQKQGKKKRIQIKRQEEKR